MDTPKIYLRVYLSLVADVADSLSWDSNHTVAYIKQRYDAEGLSFLTKTLPTLGKRFQRSLDGVSPLDLTGFRRKGVAPILYRELFEAVLDPAGRVRREADPRTIRLLRQLLLVFYKLEVPYPSESCDKVIKDFIRNDLEIAHVADVLYGLPHVLERTVYAALKRSQHTEFIAEAGHTNGYSQEYPLDGTAHEEFLRAAGPDSSRTPVREGATPPHHPGSHLEGRGRLDLGLVVQTARELITRITSGIRVEDFMPRHGPGAVATGEMPWGKFNFSIMYESLDQIWPYDEYFHASLSHFEHSRLREGRLTNALIQKNGTAKVVLVPKDSRGPRLISCEPLAQQWIQQGIARELIKTLETNRLTRGRLNFTDQSINQRYAMYGSLGAKWATLDMKDASDRVATSLVACLFQDTHILSSIMASRSTATMLPDGRVIPLHKFAPMGSALCFPVEAFVFWSLAVAAIVAHGGTLERASSHVRVYGDDIICHCEDYAVIEEAFTRVGLLLNPGKCFVQGPFRESCGVDAYNGVDVTPVYLRRTVSSDGSLAASNIPSWVEYHNELYLRGYWRTCGRIRNLIGKTMRVPIVNDWEPRSYICLRLYECHTPDEPGFPLRWNPKLQRREIFAPCMEPEYVYRTLKPYERLFRALTGHEQPVVHEDVWRKLQKTSLSTPRLPCDARRYPIRHRTTIVCRWQPE